MDFRLRILDWAKAGSKWFTANGLQSTDEGRRCKGIQGLDFGLGKIDFRGSIYL